MIPILGVQGRIEINIFSKFECFFDFNMILVWTFWATISAAWQVPPRLESMYAACFVTFVFKRLDLASFARQSNSFCVPGRHHPTVVMVIQ